MRTCLPIFLAACCLIIFLFSSHEAYAHFPATDGPITVVLHVDPNDMPIPGEQANLYFLFDDATKRFDLEKCLCAVSVMEQGKKIFSQSIVAQKDQRPSVWGVRVPYAFPRRDVYTITLTGKPMSPYAFQAFTLSWNFRVDQYPKESSTMIVEEILKNIFVAICVSLILGGVIFIAFMAVDKKKIEKYSGSKQKR